MIKINNISTSSWCGEHSALEQPQAFSFVDDGNVYVKNFDDHIAG